MSRGWQTARSTSEADVRDALMELRGQTWLCSGQAQRCDCLVPALRPARPRQGVTS